MMRDFEIKMKINFRGCCFPLHWCMNAGTTLTLTSPRVEAYGMGYLDLHESRFDFMVFQF